MIFGLLFTIFFEKLLLRFCSFLKTRFFILPYNRSSLCSWVLSPYQQCGLQILPFLKTWQARCSTKCFVYRPSILSIALIGRYYHLSQHVWKTRLWSLSNVLKIKAGLETKMGFIAKPVISCNSVWLFRILDIVLHH